MGSVIGLIAGGGKLPLLFCRSARKKGLRVVSVALSGFTSEAIEDEADVVHWVGMSELGKVPSLLVGSGAAEAVMLGKVPQTEIFSGRRRDADTEAAISGASTRQTQALLQAAAAMLSAGGVKLLDSRTHMDEYLARPGALSSRGLSDAEADDVRYGVGIAKHMGAVDIGQTVVVKNRAVLAVEAIEGTDECIRRGGCLCGGGAVVVKVSKPNQDMRFDVPVIGPETVRVCRESKVAVLAVEAGRTFVLDRDELVALADEADLAVTVIEVGDE